MVVLISIIDSAWPTAARSALRSFRILRVLKLVRSGRLAEFLYTVYITVLSLGEFRSSSSQRFSSLRCSACSSSGASVRTGLWRDPRHNRHAALGARHRAQVLTGEDWNAVMYDGVAANGRGARCISAPPRHRQLPVLNLVAILLTNFRRGVSTELKSTKELWDSIAFFRTYLSKERERESVGAAAEEKFWAELIRSSDRE